MTQKTIAIVGTLAESLVGFRGELIKDMVAAGHIVYAFVSEMTFTQQLRILELGATPIRYSLSRLGINPYQDIKTVHQLYTLFKQYRIDVSFCYFAKPVIYGTLAATLAGIPLRVAKIEGLGRPFTPPPNGFSKKQKILQNVQVFLYRCALRFSHHLFLLNPDDKRDLIDKKHIRTGQVHLINGIGLNLNHYQFQAPVTAPVRFVFIGRLLNEKGIWYYLQAAQALKEAGYRAECWVVGAPDQGRDAVSPELLKQKVHEGIIHYTGKVDDVRIPLKKSSVFVLPSYYREGVPRSTQEAMAMGRAVITTSGPGCKETVVHQKNGLLIPPHDPQALFNAMKAYINHPEWIIQHGAAGYQLALQRYDVKKINQHMMQRIGLATVVLPPKQVADVTTNRIPNVAKERRKTESAEYTD
ncbi:hypothetical protein BZG82_13420 [Salinivibrio sp. PR5]|uniref:glycosyltransferase family 4 protein n=1 Tax=Salinivibrio sp. PR5 TaxID=1909484 RepID=UPI00098BCA65|nr:glycosyltransferase family 4 protein [Salinivibrio sp. PR5]OOF08719.1 hypothetical protein BZG82_13420 [Salinivibrio sp. PR5]